MEIDRPATSIECPGAGRSTATRPRLEPIELDQMNRGHEARGQHGPPDVRVPLAAHHAARHGRRRDEVPRDLRFNRDPTASPCPQRRRYARRWRWPLPLKLVPLAEEDGNTASGDPIDTRTRDPQRRRRPRRGAAAAVGAALGGLTIDPARQRAAGDLRGGARCENVGPGGTAICANTAMRGGGTASGSSSFVAARKAGDPRGPAQSSPLVSTSPCRWV